MVFKKTKQPENVVVVPDSPVFPTPASEPPTVEAPVELAVLKPNAPPVMTKSEAEEAFKILDKRLADYVRHRLRIFDEVQVEEHVEELRAVINGKP